MKGSSQRMQISRVDIISSLLPVLKNQIEHTDRKGNTPKIKNRIYASKLDLL